jgi:hypothetical protein
MAIFRIPIEAHVWTTSGPWRAGDLPASAKLVIIGPDGRAATSSVSEISQPIEQQVAILQTTAGEIYLDARSAVSVRGARVFAATAAAEVIAGHSLRIELAHPRDLPPIAPDYDLPAATRRALALLDLPVVRVPRRLGADESLRRLLSDATVPYIDASDDRWTALAFNPPAISQFGGPLRAVDALVLQAITAWDRPHPSVTVCRTTIEQARLRYSLVAALAAAGTPAIVTWTPRYGPVEARIRPGEGNAFTTATGAAQLVLPCIDICIDNRGSAITDLAIVSQRQLPQGD